MKKCVNINRPKNFSPEFEVVACFFQVRDTFLLLQCSDQKKYGGMWGMPAGKLEAGEGLTEGLIREVFEETAVLLSAKDVAFLKTVYVCYPELDFVFHVFRTTFSDIPANFKLSAEHQDAIWVTPKKALSMNLIPGEDECIKLFYM